MAKKKESVEGVSKFQAALEKLNKAYGVGSVITLNSKNQGSYDLISTGSIGFDHITLGVGGFVKGKLYELMGWEGTGKSTICGHAVAECQERGGKVLYIDGEHAVDKIYFESLGVNTDEMLIAQPSCGEEGFQIAMDLIETGEIDLVIIDSDSSLIPKKVLDGDVGDSAIGKKAILNSNAYPKLKTALSANNVCVIVISQYREKIGVMFGNPTTTQGGHALKFYSDCRIEVSRSLAKDGDVTYGNITKIKSVKNKMSPPYRKSEFEIIYGQGIDKFAEMMNLGTEYEVLKKWGKTVTYKDEKYDLDGFRTLFSDNPEFEEDIKQSIINSIKNVKPKLEDDGL
jgi:recombination protein RecA